MTGISAEPRAVFVKTTGISLTDFVEKYGLLVFFLLLAGVFFLAEGDLKEHWPITRFAWPACFLLSGIFVMIFSDTELWPFGRHQWLHTMAVDSEVLQHKLFALILLGHGRLADATRGPATSARSMVMALRQAHATGRLLSS